MRGGASSEESVRGKKVPRRDIVSQNPLERALRSDHSKFTWHSTKRFAYDELIFFRLE